jgi:cyclophilin family peptidyl-prolyl cis-trans isomerase
MVFGCVPAPPIGPKPAAPGKEPPQRDEIDAAAMGLAERKIVDIKERDWLWQQEILPRYTLLRQGGRPVPEGLAALVQAVKDRGPSGMSVLEGKSKMWYLEAVGYRYVPGASAFPVRRGAVTTASFWPGEADERFMVALSDMPHWDGRATVFGRVVAGWETLEAIERVPVDKAHRPLTMVTIAGMARADADIPVQKKGSTR